MTNPYPESEKIFKYVYAITMDNLNRLSPDTHDSMKRTIATNVALKLKVMLRFRKKGVK